MKQCYNDITYYNLVNDIINEKEFKKIDNCTHHGLSRFDHSCRVSYYSYKTSKILRLNYKEVARAGLLHDFFLSENNTKKERVKSVFSHSKKSLKNSEDLFELSEREKDIIASHMFPINPSRVPKYMESWIVCTIDKLVATYEFACSIRTKFVLKYQNAMVLMLVILGRTL